MIIIYSPRRILKKSLYFYDSSAYFLTYCIFIHFAIVNNYNCNYGVTIYSSHNWKERRFWVRILTFSWNDLEHSQEEFSHYFTIVIAARRCITNNRSIGQNLQNYNNKHVFKLQENLIRFVNKTYVDIIQQHFLFFWKMLELEWRQCCWDVFSEINVEYSSSGDDDEKVGLKEAGFT